MLWGVITAKRSKIEPGQNLLEAVKVRSKIVSFFVKNPNFKISQKKIFGEYSTSFQDTQMLLQWIFCGKNYLVSRAQNRFWPIWGSENLKTSFLPPGGSEVNQTGIMNDGSMDLQNEPLAVRIRRNSCATLHTLRRASSVKGLLISNYINLKMNHYIRFGRSIAPQPGNTERKVGYQNDCWDLNFSRKHMFSLELEQGWSQAPKRVQLDTHLN